jgi:hypothetical protein
MNRRMICLANRTDKPGVCPAPVARDIVHIDFGKPPILKKKAALNANYASPPTLAHPAGAACLPTGRIVHTVARH